MVGGQSKVYPDSCQPPPLQSCACSQLLHFDPLTPQKDCTNFKLFFLLVMDICIILIGFGLKMN